MTKSMKVTQLWDVHDLHNNSEEWTGILRLAVEPEVLWKKIWLSRGIILSYYM